MFGKVREYRTVPQPEGMGTALPPGSRADAPRLKVDVGFMKFVVSEREWAKEVLDADNRVLCVVDIYNPLWCAPFCVD